MTIYLAHGETIRNQQILIRAKASGVLLSYKILSQKSDTYIRQLLSGYQNHLAVMIDFEDTQPDQCFTWLSKLSLNQLFTFLEPRLPHNKIKEFRKQAYQQALPLIPVWNPDKQSRQDFTDLCQTYSYIAIEGVTSKREYLKLLRLAYPYQTKLHAHSLTQRHKILKPTILKNLPLASATCTNWCDASLARYVFSFSPANRELNYQPCTDSTDRKEMDTISAQAWAQYSAFLDATQWKYWLDTQQQRFGGNRHTKKVQEYIRGNHTTKHKEHHRKHRAPTGPPELIKDSADSPNEIDKSFAANRGNIRAILRTNPTIENRRYQSHQNWHDEKRAEAILFKRYLRWAKPSGFNQRWRKYVEENNLTSEQAIARAGKHLYEEEAINILTKGYLRATAQRNAALAGLRPKFTRDDDQALALFAFIQDGEYLPPKPWVRKPNKVSNQMAK